MRVDSGVITGEWIGWFGVQDLSLQSLAGIDELGGCDFDSRDPYCGWGVRNVCASEEVQVVLIQGPKCKASPISDTQQLKIACIRDE